MQHAINNVNSAEVLLQLQTIIDQVEIFPPFNRRSVGSRKWFIKQKTDVPCHDGRLEKDFQRQASQMRIAKHCLFVIKKAGKMFIYHQHQQQLLQQLNHHHHRRRCFHRLFGCCCIVLASYSKCLSSCCFHESESTAEAYRYPIPTYLAAF